MRRELVAWCSALLAHGAVVAIAYAVMGERPPAHALSAITPVPPPPATNEPMAISFVTLPANSAPVSRDVAALPIRSSPPAASIATSRPSLVGDSDVAAPRVEAAATEHHGLGMRFPKANLQLSAESMLATTRPGAVDKSDAPTPTGELQDDGNGTKRSDQGPFLARVAADGTATFIDKKFLPGDFHVPIPDLQTLKTLGQLITNWDPEAMRAEGTRMMAPDAKINEGPAWDDGATSGGRFGSDMTDWVMRRHHQDPYAALKLAFLDRTRGERIGMAQHHRDEQLARSAEFVRKQIDALWQRLDVAMAMKRELLFELWDDSAEVGVDRDDTADVDALGEAGSRARAQVIGFIRAHLPAESADCYAAAELTELNKKRHSKQAFEPYAPAP